MTIHPAKTLVFALLWAITASVQPLYAQKLRASRFHYSTDNGLSSNAVSDIKQDDFGYIWIATWNGLSRFDGFEFFNYPMGRISGIPLLHNRIRTFG